MPVSGGEEKEGGKAIHKLHIAGEQPHGKRSGGFV